MRTNKIKLIPRRYPCAVFVPGHDVIALDGRFRTEHEALMKFRKLAAKGEYKLECPSLPKKPVKGTYAFFL